jgi:hypothetical protein
VLNLKGRYMISDKFLDEIPENIYDGLSFITDKLLEYHKQNHKDGVAGHNGYVEYYFVLVSYLKKNKYSFEQFELSDNKVQNIKSIMGLRAELVAELEKINDKLFIKNTQERFDKLFDNVFNYEFTKGDLERIQTLISELRDSISQSDLFTDEHQQRLLKRLEKLQSELHKKVSDLDRFWGLIGDAGVAIGKFGKDAKPIVDRIKEISQIVWNTQSRAEELPSGTSVPFLSDDKKKN